MKNNLATDAAQLLCDAYPKIKAEYEKLHPGYTLGITCVHRTPEEQYALYEKGRTKPGDIVTQIDGKTKLGAHNYYPARAIDVVVVGTDTGKEYWDETRYSSLVQLASAHGLESGGSWTSFKDWPHIQIPHFRDYKGA
jgi:peptidoglycan L-alanyl-D-glutamate endopeptidase CwlK